ncbi:hypothetical protein ElyMa_002907900, partial [Elysia marginata]
KSGLSRRETKETSQQPFIIIKMALLLTGVLCVAIIAVSLPGSSWACQRCPSRKPHLDNEVDNQDGVHDHKTWLFSVNGRKRPYSFLDDYGNLIGFDVDLIDE